MQVFDSFDSTIYIKEYYDFDTHGFVVIHKTHGLNELEGNRTIAILLAKLGYRVVLQPNTPAIPMPDMTTPDAVVNEEIWEFKTISHTGNLSNRVHKVISKGKHQSSKVLIYIAQSYKTHEITRGIENAIRVDLGGFIEKVAILFQDGRLIFVKREEVLDKSFINKFLLLK
jgi:Contact-dependent growth inhibition CdiA C-terminal domain